MDARVLEDEQHLLMFVVGEGQRLFDRWIELNADVTSHKAENKARADLRCIHTIQYQLHTVYTYAFEFGIWLSFYFALGQLDEWVGASRR